MPETANKRTSQEGFVHPVPFGTQGRLFDFDIDGAEVGVDGARLKPQHIAFLQSLLARIGNAPNQRLVIRIGGMTDTLNRTGTFNNNQLSDRRARAVQLFIQSKLPPGVNVKFDVRPFGAEPASKVNAANVRDDFFRAVVVALIAPGDPEPQAPKVPGGPVVPPSGGRTGPREFPRKEFSFSCVREFEMPRSQDFSVRLESVSSIGVLLKPIMVIFLIRDNSNRLEAQYTLQGVNVGSLPDLIIKNQPTQFRSFRTDRPTRVTEFKSAVITTKLGSPPSIKFTYRDENGNMLPANSEIDFGDIKNSPPRVITGLLTMDTTCGFGVRGANKVFNN
jgi:hypothetical protein